MPGTLAPYELIRLLGIQHELHRVVQKWEKVDPLANYLVYPRLPAILGESAVLHLIRDNHTSLPSGPVTRDTTKADLCVNQTHLVEVKSSSRDYVHLKEGDINADWLVWLHFGELLSFGEKHFEMYVIKKPNILSTGKLHLREMKKYDDGLMYHERITLTELYQANPIYQRQLSDFSTETTEYPTAEDWFILDQRLSLTDTDYNTS